MLILEVDTNNRHEIIFWSEEVVTNILGRFFVVLSTF
jgi:hypothetical protein